MKKDIRQLNAFEIKQEISRFANSVCKSKILIDEKEFELLDSQENKDDIVKLLLKEFKRCNDEIMPEIKILLERYAESEYLIDAMESILTDGNNSNDLKLHAIEVLSHVNKNWHEEDYQQYLEYDEEKMFEDTKQLLQSSKSNPEIQLDFLDFFATIADSDKYILLEAMADEQEGENLANILVPIFLTYMDSPIGIFALNLLKSTKSVYAYRSLSEIYDIVSENLKPVLKKCLTELKFSGVDRVKEKINDYADGVFSFVPPDVDGSFCLFYEKKYVADGNNQSDFFSVVCNDRKGIDECIGFTGVSEAEIGVLRSNLLEFDKDVEITPEVFKYFLHNAEKITYKNSAPPYEYNCWKQLFLDIPQKEFDLNKTLSSLLKVKKYSNSELTEIFEAEFTAYWFYPKDLNDDTEHYFSTVNEVFQTDNFKKIDLSNLVKSGSKFIIQDDEKKRWHERLLLSAYYCVLKKSLNYAQILYSIAHEERYQQVFYDYIIKYSIFHHFWNLKNDRDFASFSELKLAQILEFLGVEWGFYV